MQPGQGIQTLAPDHERLAALIHKGEVFAFPLEVVREVVPMSELLTPVCSAPCVMGFILLRGVQVPVMDLSGVMHYGGQAGSETYTSEQPASEQSDVVAILRFDDCLLGLVIDAVVDVLKVKPDQFSHLCFDANYNDAWNDVGTRTVSSSGASQPEVASQPRTGRLVLGSYTLESDSSPSQSGAKTALLIDEQALFSIPGVPLTRVEPLRVQRALKPLSSEQPDADAAANGPENRANNGAENSDLSDASGSHRAETLTLVSDDESGLDDKHANTNTSASSGNEARRPPPTYSPHVLVVRIRRHYFAIQARLVQTTLADYDVDVAPIDNEMYVGEIRFQDQSIAIADWSQLFWESDEEPPPRNGRLPLLIYQMPQGLLGLMVDEVLDVLPTPAVEALPLPKGALPGGDLMTGVLPLEQLYKQGKTNIGTDFVLLFDDDRIRATESLGRLASMARRLSPSAYSGASTNTAGSAEHSKAGSTAHSVEKDLHLQQMLIVDAGVEVCCQIRDVVEIFRLRQSHRINMPGTPLCGLATVRGRAVPVYQLAGLIGQVSTQQEGEVLVVRAGDGWVGFMVQALKEIQFVQWQRQVDIPALSRPDGVDYGQYKACWSLCGLQTPEGLKTTPSLNLGKLAEVYTDIFPALSFHEPS